MTRLMYVVAASHSGSTLLSMLLNTHPSVATAGELKAVNLGDPARYRCSCHEFIQDCAFWRDVNERMQALGHDFCIWHAGTHFDSIDSAYVQRLISPLVRRAPLEALRQIALNLSPAWRSGRKRIMQRSVDLVRSFAEVAGVDVVVESSKIGQRLLQLSRQSDLDIHVVRMVRDGRAVALTYMQPGEFADAQDETLRGGGSGGFRDKRLPMAAAAREWRRSNEEAEALLPQLDVASLSTVSYESLCTDPLGTLNGIYADAGLAPIDDIGAFKEVEHHVIGNGMRLDKESHITLDERWREVLGSEDLQTFEREAGALNRQYGYS